MHILGAFPLHSTPVRGDQAKKSQSSFVDVTGESEVVRTRSQLFDQNNGSFSGNPFSVMEIGDSESESMPDEQRGDVSIEPIYDDHHFDDVEERYLTTILFSKSTPEAKR